MDHKQLCVMQEETGIRNKTKQYIFKTEISNENSMQFLFSTKWKLEIRNNYLKNRNQTKK